MSIDNSGVILVGTKGSIHMLMKFLSDDERDDASSTDFVDWIFSSELFSSVLLLEWQVGKPSGYETSELVGFYIESPPYGSRAMKLSNFMADITKIAKLWIEHFGNAPEVFVLNLQS